MTKFKIYPPPTPSRDFSGPAPAKLVLVFVNSGMMLAGWLLVVHVPAYRSPCSIIVLSSDNPGDPGGNQQLEQTLYM